MFALLLRKFNTVPRIYRLTGFDMVLVGGQGMDGASGSKSSSMLYISKLVGYE